MHPWGLGEILFIVLIVLIFWGPQRLSGLGKGLGDGIRNFKAGLRGGSDATQKQSAERPQPPPAVAPPQPPPPAGRPPAPPPQ